MLRSCRGDRSDANKPGLAAVGSCGQAAPWPGRPWQWSGQQAQNKLPKAGRPGWALHEEGQLGGVLALDSPRWGAWAGMAEHTPPPR